MMGVMPRLVGKLAFATILFETMHIWFDGRPNLWPDAPSWVIAILFTTTLFILDDAAKYVIHRALHRIPLLWCFHRVHHTAETLTPFTVYTEHIQSKASSSRFARSSSKLSRSVSSSSFSATEPSY